MFRSGLHLLYPMDYFKLNLFFKFPVVSPKHLVLNNYLVLNTVLLNMRKNNLIKFKCH